MTKIDRIKKDAASAWEKIAPSWPIQNIIACNPLLGFEHLKFDEALKEGAEIFQNGNHSEALSEVNRISIKWLQVYFDQGQTIIEAPQREFGFFKSWIELAEFDQELHCGDLKKIKAIKEINRDSTKAIADCLNMLEVEDKDREKFLTILLSSLSGWSAYTKYLANWSYSKNEAIANDYLAFRLVITAMIYPNAKEIVQKSNPEIAKTVSAKLEEIKEKEAAFQRDLLSKIEVQNPAKSTKKADAQFVFCIDVRSEPVRRIIESIGNYQTLGFAGFFGVATDIHDDVTQETNPSCPVLLTPKYSVTQGINCSHKSHKSKTRHHKKTVIKKTYQSLKYNFATPLPLAEAMGIWSGLMMLGKTIKPYLPKLDRRKNEIELAKDVDLDQIDPLDRVNIAAGALKTMGLTENFSEIVVLCGHGSFTENNSFATALDCGACGGRHGDGNARILAKILNDKNVRTSLAQSNIKIPRETKFVAGRHNTTNDEIAIFEDETFDEKIAKIKQDLAFVRNISCFRRMHQMEVFCPETKAAKAADIRGRSWSQTRPEWGLAKNAAFIAAPRELTANIDLDGRAFLHSYNWKIDHDNSALDLILNAPMVVAQWINSQYLFSTLDNVSFGAGSKITHNIVGKIGVMQGNGSDLMNGLPMQSLFLNDQQKYHEPLRLTTIVYAKPEMINSVIAKSPKLQNLFGNDWVALFCIDPSDKKILKLESSSLEFYEID
jgi:uncharacterized protein YbcC (UPF0753/DUF2309 family)